MNLSLRNIALKYECPNMTAEKSSRVIEINNIEEKLFENIESYNRAIGEGDHDSTNFFNSRVNELARQYAKYCV